MRFVRIVLILMLLALPAVVPVSGQGGVVSAAERTPVTLRINGYSPLSDVQPFIENGRTFVPIRPIADVLDYDAKWDPKTKTVTITRGKTTVKMTVGRKTVTVNGRAKAIDVAPMIVGGRTVIPIAHVASVFGATAWYDASNRTVYVSTGYSGSNPPMAADLRRTDDVNVMSYFKEITYDHSNPYEGRIEPLFKEALEKIRQGKKPERGLTLAYPDVQIPFYQRYTVQELLWAYYKGPIPASTYEAEWMRQATEGRTDGRTWDELTAEEVLRQYGMLKKFELPAAILLDYTLDAKGRLQSFIIRPIGMRHAFKFTIKDPVGSFVLSPGWAGYADDDFTGIYSVPAGREVLEELKRTGQPFHFYKAGGYLDENGTYRYDPPRLVGVPRYGNKNSYALFHQGGDFLFEVYPPFGKNHPGELEPGSTILAPYFLERKKSNLTEFPKPFDEKARTDMEYSYGWELRFLKNPHKP